MRIPLVVYPCIAFLFTVSLDAAQITTVIEADEKEPRAATLVARRLDAPAVPIEQSITVPGTSDVHLPDGLWELRVAGASLWMVPVHVRHADSALVKLWPVVPVAGTRNGAGALRVRFTSQDANGPSGEVDCETAEDRWTCRIPPGRHDLRFSSGGSAPEFRFGIAVPSDDAGSSLRLRFVPGASLSGRVEAARGAKLSLEGVEISLIPASGESASGRHVVRSDAKGFFQFKGLAPGDYSLRAERKGLAAQTTAVKVLAAVAAELNAPLLLDTPKRLTVTVMPPTDPAGMPWALSLVSVDRRLRRSDVVSESRVSPAGLWISPALVAGEYTVYVRTAAGEEWKEEAVTIGNDDMTLAVTAAAAKLRGRITVGDRPLQARLSFGGESGVKIHSDADGRFAGSIPPGAEGDEQVILVEAETPRVQRTIRATIVQSESGDRHLTIDLPATTLLGRVLNEDRTPASYGRISVTGNQPDTFEQVFAEADGSFQIAGYEAASYRVTAYAFERSSKSMDIELRKGESTEIELILQREERVTGRVTMSEMPVIAAEVYAFPRDAWGPTIPQAMTDENGYFELTLPPGTTRFDVFAVHPAFDITFGRTILRKGKELQIRTNQLGGTIVVESTSDKLVLRHHGSEMTAGWLVHRAGAMKTADRLTVPRLEPGQYAACTVDRKTCASGYLAPHGTLTLTLN